MHGLPCCASVRGVAACWPDGGCYAVSRCARAATILYQTIFTTPAAAAKEIPLISHDWLIKNAELVNEGRCFHADLRVKGAQVIDASGLWRAFDR
jgi:hypothetical protein